MGFGCVRVTGGRADLKDVQMFGNLNGIYQFLNSKPNTSAAHPLVALFEFHPKLFGGWQVLIYVRDKPVVL